MSNTPHMLPCPFCGGDARHDAHADDCYFILHRKFNNSGADMSLAFEVLDAWNRRAPQPVVREPLGNKELQAISLEYSDSEDECTGFRDGWRFAEKHYGITQKGGQHER